MCATNIFHKMARYLIIPYVLFPLFADKYLVIMTGQR